MTHDPKPVYLFCPQCGHGRHQAGKCRQVYKDQTNCDCQHDCEPPKSPDKPAEEVTP